MKLTSADHRQERFNRIMDLEDELRELKEEDRRAKASHERKNRFEAWLEGYGPDSLEVSS